MNDNRDEVVDGYNADAEEALAFVSGVTASHFIQGVGTTPVAANDNIQLEFDFMSDVAGQ